jgi:hypothetical protein
MTNTYQALCDDVEAYGEIFMSCHECRRAGFVEDTHSCTREECPLAGHHYPPQSAEQRERLEELILKLGRLSYHKSDIYYICILSRVNNTNNGMAGTRPEALYALTHKLVAEGVLSKEEVAKALKGGE